MDALLTFPLRTRLATLMYLPPGLRRLGKRLFHVVLAAYAGKLDQHRQVDAGDDFGVAAAHHRDCEIGGVPPNMSVRDDDAMAVVCAGHRFENVLPSLIHVVLRTDTDRFDEFLRTDDVLDRMTELFSQLAMSDKHKSDHDITAPNGIRKRWPPYRNRSNHVHRWGHILADKKPKCKTKNTDV